MFTARSRRCEYEVYRLFNQARAALGLQSEDPSSNADEG